MQNILITGAAGFIGSNFVWLIEKMRPDWKVKILDKLTYAAGSGGGWQNLHLDKNWPNVVELKFTGDICDLETVKELIQGMDAVIHFAAESHVDRSVADLAAIDFVKNNVIGTTNLLVAAKEVGIKKFLYIGTDEEYGSIIDGSFSETDLLMPSSPYSASKAGGTLMALAFWRSFNLPVIVTRSSNNFGPFQQVEKFIPRSITELIEGRKIKLYGSGANVRDWIYVEDNCLAILKVLEQGQPGEIYNIGAGNEISNLEIAQRIITQMEPDKTRIEYVNDRPGHDFRYSVNTAKLRDLGWRPTWDFDQALVKTIKWYRENQEWWRPQKESIEQFYQQIGR
jgi:dTDP-glucose 4,6-dehydratase